MKLEDPRLEAMLSEYRAARRPSAPEREAMLRRLTASVSTPVLGRAFVLALAASVAALWLAQRLWQERVAVAPRDAAAEAEYQADPIPASAEATAADRGDVPVATLPGPPVSPTSVAPQRRGKTTADRAGAIPGTRETTEGSSAEPGRDVDELAIIAAAEASLRAGDARGALVSLDEHARAHPRGLAVEEREALRVIATCELGDTDRATTGRAEFLARYPRSAYRKRVERTCAR